MAAQRWGRRAEWRALLLLWAKGYRILARRHQIRAAGAGEIDIIARRGGIIAFIEVKARASTEVAAAAISAQQRRRIERAAAIFLAHHPQLAALTARFDAILVVPRRWPHHMIDAWRRGD